MPLLNAGSTVATAWLRTVWVGLGAFAGVTIPFYLSNKNDMGRADAIEEAVLWGLAALFGAGVIRGGVEGTADGLRDSKGDVKSGDVGQPPAEARRKRAANRGT